MSSQTQALDRIALALEDISSYLKLIAPPPLIPSPLDKPLGRESIQFIDEEQLWQLEQDESQMGTYSQTSK